jgi:uncharacterized protein (DUF433 family)
MPEQSWRQHIRTDPAVFHGVACVAGTRIPASVVLDNLAAGLSEAEILESYPALTRDALGACLAYATDLARERLVDLPA